MEVYNKKNRLQIFWEEKERKGTDERRAKAKAILVRRYTVLFHVALPLPLSLSDRFSQRTPLLLYLTPTSQML
uniref:Uncharacterized protein n=1 Tax=Rhizophora mucronata TaxID=61149 RepID=A0A2P2KAF1_RHIMU